MLRPDPADWYNCILPGAAARMESHIIVSPDQEIVEILLRALKDRDCTQVCKAVLADAVAALDGAHADLVVIGGLDFMASWEACLATRTHSITAAARILVASERVALKQAPALIEAGADDCYCHKLDAAALAGRVADLMRHAGAPRKPWRTEDYLRFAGSLILNVPEKKATVEGLPADLSRAQAELLMTLMRAGNNPVPMAQLQTALKRMVLNPSPALVGRELRALRDKLGKLGTCLQTDAAGSTRLVQPPSPTKSAT